MEGVVGTDGVIAVEELLDFLDGRAGEARRIGAALVTESSARLAELFMTCAGAWDDKGNRSARDGGGRGAYGQHL